VNGSSERLSVTLKLNKNMIVLIYSLLLIEQFIFTHIYVLFNYTRYCWQVDYLYIWYIFLLPNSIYNNFSNEKYANVDQSLFPYCQAIKKQWNYHLHSFLKKPLQFYDNMYCQTIESFWQNSLVCQTQFSWSNMLSGSTCICLGIAIVIIPITNWNWKLIIFDF